MGAMWCSATLGSGAYGEPRLRRGSPRCERKRLEARLYRRFSVKATTGIELVDRSNRSVEPYLTREHMGEGLYQQLSLFDEARQRTS
jgi:hypothetical protein